MSGRDRIHAPNSRAAPTGNHMAQRKSLKPADIDKDSQEPDEGPKMPPSVPLDTFFNAFTEKQRLEHLQDSLYQAALIRREVKQNGSLPEKITIQSNYQRLLAVIDNATSASAASSHKISTLHEALKQASKYHDEDEDDYGDDGVSTHRKREVSGLQREDEHAYARLRDGFYHRDPTLAIAKRVEEYFATAVSSTSVVTTTVASQVNTSTAAGMGTAARMLAQPVAFNVAAAKVPHDVIEKGKQAVVTLGRQKLLEEAELRDRSSRSLRESMQYVGAQVRRNVVRSSSYPRAMYCVGAYKDYKDQYDELRLKCKQLQKVCDNLEPRDQERKLESKIEELDRQIVNQLALIKGLREKVRLLRDAQHPASVSCGRRSPSADYLSADGNNSVADGGTPGAGVLRNGSLTSATLPDGSVCADGGGVPNASFSSVQTRLKLGAALRSISSAPAAHEGHRGANCVVVVVDLENGKYLWETLPETLKTQTALLHQVNRQEAARWRGYEALQRDDKFLFVFANSYDAVQFGVQVQFSLMQQEWNAVLAETPETATENLATVGRVAGKATTVASLNAMQAQYLWRGLRAKIGIDIGAEAVNDPVFPNRISYEGRAIEAADYLQKLSMGGELLISTAAADQISDAQWEKIGSPIIEDWGSVTYHPCRISVRRVTPSILEGRRVVFNRQLSTAERQLHEEADATEASDTTAVPSGRVTLVTVLCPTAKVVKASVSEVAFRDTMQRVYHAVQSMARTEGGYISQMNLDELTFVLAFSDPYSCIKFSVDLQLMLLEVPWSPDVLRVPESAEVRIRDKVLYRGLRVNVGIHQLSSAPVTFRDPMEGRVIFQAPDAKLSSLIAAAACDGEILIGDSLLHYTMERFDDLHCPTVDYVDSIPTPSADTLLRLFHVFPQALQERAAFVNRELRLRDENPDALNADVVIALRGHVQNMQKKLYEKEQWIHRLHLSLDHKTEAINHIRRYVLRQPVIHMDVSTIVSDFDVGFEFPNEVIIVAFGFANAEELFDLEGAHMPDAIDVFDAFVEKAIRMFDGREIRRLPSRMARLVAFPDALLAVSCWFFMLKQSIHEEWPPKLEDSTNAGIVMASDLFPGIQPDAVVWRGLRLTCAMHSAVCSTRFNPLTRAFEVVGEDVNILAEMLRCAGPGDALVTPRFVGQHRERLERSTTETQFQEYGPFTRITDVTQRYRNRAMQASFPPIEVRDPPVPRQVSAFVVFVMMQDTFRGDGSLIHEESDASPSAGDGAVEGNDAATADKTRKREVPRNPSEILNALFPKDVQTYNACLIRTIEAHRGKLLASNHSDYLVCFENEDDGCRFAVYLHDELLRCQWTREIQRIYDFRCIHIDDIAYDASSSSKTAKVEGPLVRGIRAKVGCHCISDLNEVVDWFSGRDVWYHNQLSIPFALAVKAHCGETLSSSVARDAFRSAFTRNTVNFVVEPCGTMSSDPTGRREAIYQLFSVQLKGRMAYFIEEDKRFNDHMAAQQREREAKVYERRRSRYALMYDTDTKFLADCERNRNPFDDPIHRKTQRLHAKIRPQLDEERSRFLTCQDTLALIETVSMMAEDQLLLGDADAGMPYYAHLMLHQLEHGRQCTDVFYKKDLAAELLGNALLSGAPQTVEISTAEVENIPVVSSNSEAPPQRQPSVRKKSSGSSGNAANSTVRLESSVMGSDDVETLDSPVSPSVAETRRLDSPSATGTTAAMLRKTVFRTNFLTIAIPPEDIVQLHIDIEMFYQLLRLYGLEDPTGFTTDFMRHAFRVACPDRDPDAYDRSVLWEKVTSMRSVIGMDITSIDFQKMRCSMLAYLALSYQELSRVDI